MTEAVIRIPAKLHDVFRGRADVRGAYGGRGSGKCLGIGTLLLRADASLVAVEDVRVGDQLLGPDGKPRNVVGTARGIGPLYRVRQKTGMTFVCNDAHILAMERSKSAAEDFGSISAAGNRQRPNGRYAGYDTGLGYSLITAAEYSGKPERFKCQHFGFRRAVVGIHRDNLPVDPYLLGLWLGDGSSGAAEITSIDGEIVSYLRKTCEANGWAMKVRDEDRAPVYYIGSNYKRNGFLQQLRDAGVLNNKHIPECYFGASIDQRRALLAGLVDTDGSVSKGCITISQSREPMLRDIVRLAHGLGMKASVRKIHPKCSTGKVCEAWRSEIGGDINTLPLRIERKRKAALEVRKNKDWRRSRVDVELIGDGEYFGFELDGDHLFMLADGTVTHNTRSFAKMAAVQGMRYGQAGIKGQILCARQFMNSLDDSSLEEVKRAIEDEPILLAYYEIGQKYVKSRDGNVWFSFAGLDRSINSIKSKGRILLCWVDEAEPVTDEAWSILIPTLREEGGEWNAELWVTWNPKRKNAAVEKRFRASDDPLIKIVEMNWRDNPRFPDKLERERQRDLEDRPDDYDHIWEGAHVTAVTGAYYAKQLAAAKAEGRITRLTADPLMTYRAHVDIGGTGRTSDAFSMWVGQWVSREVRILNYYEAQGQEAATHIAWLREHGYTPANTTIVLPHDGAAQDKVYAVSYQGYFQQAGYTVLVIPNMGRGAAKARIEAARRVFPRMWFDDERTEAGREAIGWYHERKDEKRDIGLGPNHDWSSHAADSFGLLAVDYELHPPSSVRKARDVEPDWKRKLLARASGSRNPMTA